MLGSSGYVGAKVIEFFYELYSGRLRTGGLGRLLPGRPFESVFRLHLRLGGEEDPATYDEVARMAWLRLAMVE